jgi:hypothetical protein
MPTPTEMLLPTVFAVCAIGGYVIWKSRRARSKRSTITPTSNDSVETSEFGQGTLIISRCFVAMLIGIIGFTAWNDRGLPSGPRSAAAAWAWIVGVASLIVLSWYVLGLLMRSSFRSLSYDKDGLWRTRIGKSRGLVLWRDICRIKERSSALVLIDSDGRSMLEVDYERDDYFSLRTLLMERMPFSPPALPLILGGSKIGTVTKIAFAVAALLSLGAAIYLPPSPNSHGLVVLLLFCAVVFSLLAIPATENNH